MKRWKRIGGIMMSVIAEGFSHRDTESASICLCCSVVFTPLGCREGIG